MYKIVLCNDNWTHKCESHIRNARDSQIFNLLRHVLRTIKISYQPILFKQALKSCLSLDFGIAHCQRGDGEIRTLDPLLARQVLSQLSYTPIGTVSCFFIYIFNRSAVLINASHLFRHVLSHYQICSRSI